MNFEALVREVKDRFRAVYDREPRWIAAAPGRVNLIGEHTDYNDGFVFPMAIERYTVVAADTSRHAPARIRLQSTAQESIFEVELERDLKPLPRGAWANYPLGVVAGFMRRGYKLLGLDVLVHSTVPLGGGVSSSAALEVATATLLEAVAGSALDPVEKALLCQQAEHEFAGMPCGIMDQFIATMAQEDHAMLLDCRSRVPELIPMNDHSVAVLVINTNVKHELTGSEYPTRRKQCETAARILGVKALRDADLPQLDNAKPYMDHLVYRRAHHVITENARTLEAARAMKAADWARFGELMYQSHESLRVDYEVSCVELDAVVEVARGLGLAGGVYGCRMTGGGFGGCCVALVRAEKADEITRKIGEGYKVRTGRDATIFLTRPAPGARLLQG